MKNKQVKQMLTTTFQELFHYYAMHGDNKEVKVWAFDRLRLCEMGFDRQRLRFPNISKVSIKESELPKCKK